MGFGCFWIAENELHELRQRVLNTLYDISILFFGEKFKFIGRQDFKEYRDSILFLKNNKNIHILSGISGDYNNIDFKYFHVRQSEGKKSKHTLFYGFVLEFDYPKQFESQTIITKDYGFIKNRLSSYGRILNRVKFENKSFEKNNEVYSDNPDEAKYLLDEVLVEKLRQVTQKFNEYEILFKNQKIIIKVATPKILFDKNIEIHEVIDFKSQTEKLFKDISYVFSLIDFIVFDDNIG